MQRDNNGKPLGGITGRGFMPGHSGNPGGRPKGTVKLSTRYERSLARPFPDDPEGRTYAQVIADKAVELASRGDIAAIKEVTDRTEGKASQRVEVAGNVALGLNRETIRAFAELWVAFCVANPLSAAQIIEIAATPGGVDVIEAALLAAQEAA